MPLVNAASVFALYETECFRLQCSGQKSVVYVFDVYVTAINV